MTKKKRDAATRLASPENRPQVDNNNERAENKRKVPEKQDGATDKTVGFPDARIDLAVDLLLGAVEAEQRLKFATRRFREVASGVDQRAIVERAAQRLAAVWRTRDLAAVESVVWHDAGFLFGWHDLAKLAVEGCA